MKQTAVEFLKKMLKDNSSEVFEGNIWEQAKEMEKQQIIDAHGNKEKKSTGVTNYTYILSGEEYYNENFKNK
jgi:hypothetical protein